MVDFFDTNINVASKTKQAARVRMAKWSKAPDSRLSHVFFFEKRYFSKPEEFNVMLGDINYRSHYVQWQTLSNVKVMLYFK